MSFVRSAASLPALLLREPRFSNAGARAKKISRAVVNQRPPGCNEGF
jgi:hypothetical protein